MFIGYCKQELKKRARSAVTIEAKRQRVIDRIDAWLAGLADGGGDAWRLSRLQDGRRLVWLPYGKHKVPLTADGETIGEIDAGQDETAFWLWMKEQVAMGAYDTGILQLSATIRHRLSAGRRGSRSE